MTALLGYVFDFVVKIPNFNNFDNPQPCVFPFQDNKDQYLLMIQTSVHIGECHGTRIFVWYYTMGVKLLPATRWSSVLRKQQ